MSITEYSKQSGTNAYLASIINPWEHLIVKPDFDESFKMPFRVTYQDAITAVTNPNVGAASSAGLFYMRPSTQDTANVILHYVKATDGRYYLYQSIKPSLDVTTDFIRGSCLSFGAKARSNTIATGVVTLSGQWKAIHINKTPDLADIEYTTLESYASRETAYSGISDSFEGVAAYYPPDGKSSMTSFETDFLVDPSSTYKPYRQSGALPTRGFTQAVGAILPAGQTVIWDSNLDADGPLPPPNFWGVATVRANVYVSNPVAVVGEAQLELTWTSYDAVSPVDVSNFVQLLTVPEVVAGAGIAYRLGVKIETQSLDMSSLNPTRRGVLTRIRLLFNDPALLGTFVYQSARVELESSEYFGVGERDPALIMSYENMTINQQLTLNAVQNYEVVPGASLQRIVKVGAISDGLPDDIVASKVAMMRGMSEAFGLRVCWKIPEYTKFTSSEIYSSLITRGPSFAKMADSGAAKIPFFKRVLDVIKSPVRFVGDIASRVGRAATTFIDDEGGDTGAVRYADRGSTVRLDRELTALISSSSEVPDLGATGGSEEEIDYPSSDEESDDNYMIDESLWEEREPGIGPDLGTQFADRPVVPRPDLPGILPAPVSPTPDKGSSSGEPMFVEEESAGKEEESEAELVGSAKPLSDPRTSVSRTNKLFNHSPPLLSPGGLLSVQRKLLEVGSSMTLERARVIKEEAFKSVAAGIVPSETFNHRLLLGLSYGVGVRSTSSGDKGVVVAFTTTGSAITGYSYSEIFEGCFVDVDIDAGLHPSIKLAYAMSFQSASPKVYLHLINDNTISEKSYGLAILASFLSLPFNLAFTGVLTDSAIIADVSNIDLKIEACTRANKLLLGPNSKSHPNYEMVRSLIFLVGQCFSVQGRIGELYSSGIYAKVAKQKKKSSKGMTDEDWIKLGAKKTAEGRLRVDPATALRAKAANAIKEFHSYAESQRALIAAKGRNAKKSAAYGPAAKKGMATNLAKYFWKTKFLEADADIADMLTAIFVEKYDLPYLYAKFEDYVGAPPPASIKKRIAASVTKGKNLFKAMPKDDDTTASTRSKSASRRLRGAFSSAPTITSTKPARATVQVFDDEDLAAEAEAPDASSDDEAPADDTDYRDVLFEDEEDVEEVPKARQQRNPRGRQQAPRSVQPAAQPQRAKSKGRRPQQQQPRPAPPTKVVTFTPKGGRDRLFDFRE